MEACFPWFYTMLKCGAERQAMKNDPMAELTSVMDATLNRMFTSGSFEDDDTQVVHS